MGYPNTDPDFEATERAEAAAEADRLAHLDACAEAHAGPGELPDGWSNHEGYRQIFCAALTGICANPQFFGPLFQQSPEAAVEFAASVVRAALANAERA